MDLKERLAWINSPTCHKHPGQPTAYSNRAGIDHLHYLAIFNYCQECGQAQLTDHGQGIYGLEPPT